MLASIVLCIRPVKQAAIPCTMGSGVHACLFKIITLVDETFSNRLHSGKGEKPFTVSPLQGEFVAYQGGLKLDNNNQYWLRFTSLDQELSLALLNLDENVLPAIHLFNHSFEVVKIAKGSEKHPWAATTTHGRLHQQWLDRNDALPNKVRLKFLSPTTFHLGKRNLPLPLPELVFSSLAKKWDGSAPIPLDVEVVQMLRERVLLSAFNLKTVMLDFGRFHQVGFIGDCEFTLSMEEDEVLVKILHLLSDFAFYAGVGYKTTMGMGQTRKIEPVVH
ncbi:CRISPR-associated endoribonuclease Cas6 [Dehalococcoidales bacterium]|nr:CRISPR-associated endoribonuclease Cas6 [Dehalococcoidales bacterium]